MGRTDDGDGGGTTHEAMIAGHGFDRNCDPKFVRWFAKLLEKLEQRAPRTFYSTAVFLFSWMSTEGGIPAFRALCVERDLTVDRILADDLYDVLLPGRSETFASICAAEEAAIGAELQRKIAEVAVLPDTDITCPICARRKAITSFAQTRSSDEPLTEYGECPFPDCKHKWRI